MPSSDHDKAELRAAMIGRRRALSESHIQQASLAAGRRLEQTGHFRDARTVGAYVAVGGELDPAYLSDSMIADNKQLYLPILDRRHSLLFAPAGRDTPMQTNRYGIPEPVCKPGELVKADQLDLLIIPLVVFDPDGHRLGMGAGYYDRALAATVSGQPVRAGFAYEFQRVESVQPESWDIPMDLIVTDRRIYTPAWTAQTGPME